MSASADRFAELASELCGVTPPSPEAARAEMITLFHFGGGLRVLSGAVVLESEPVARGAASRLSTIVKQLFDFDAPVMTGLVGHRGAAVRVGPDAVTGIAGRLGLITRAGQPVVGLPPWLVARAAADTDVAAGALRGAVLATGRLNRTHQNVLSLIVHTPGFAASVALRGVARHLGAAAMIREDGAGRFGDHRVVLRDRTGLAGALEAMGACEFARTQLDPAAAERRAEQGAILRRANDQRAAEAASLAADKIRAALDVLGDDVPVEMAVLARMRLENPTESIAALGRRCGMTKDAVAGRLRRLRLLADERAALLGISA